MTRHLATEDGSPPRSWGRSVGLLSIATVVVSVANYAFSLVAVRLLSPGAFSTFAASQGLLLVLGTGCMAAVPWAVARYMVTEQHAHAAQEALRFGLLASAWQAVVVGPIAGVIVGLTAGPVVGLVTGVSGALIALTAAPTGFLQGGDRLATISWLRLVEVAGRLVFGLGLVVVVAPSATNALLGFPVGTGLLLIGGMLASRNGFPLRRAHRSAVRSLMRQSFALGLVQVLISMLAALDAVVAQASRFGPQEAGSYQAAALIGRVPLFLSGAIALAVYTAMAGARSEAEVGTHLRKAVLIYLAVALPIVIACCTVPLTLLHVVIPAEYSTAPTLLRFTVISGALIGLINVVTTAHQARGAFRTVIRILLPTALLQPLLLLIAGRSFGMTAFVWTLVGVSVVGTVLVCRDARRWQLLRPPSSSAVWIVLLLALCVEFWVRNPVLWAVYGGAVSALLIIRAARVFSGKQHVRRDPTPSGRHHQPDEPSGGDRWAASGQPLRRHIIEGRDPSGPRVAVIGDSMIFGLGYHRNRAFGRLIADDLHFSALLNVSGSARTSMDTLNLYGDQIQEFRPTVVIASMGAAEAMVHPRAPVQQLIERYAPATWHGVAGLEPRARFSDDRLERVRQAIQSGLKVTVKWVLIQVTGGGPRVPLEQALVGARTLLDLLVRTGADIYMVGLPHAPAVLFPGTERSFQATMAAHLRMIADLPTVTYVPVADLLDYYGDFLGDRIHLGGAGHRRVADIAMAEIRRRTAGPLGTAPEDHSVASESHSVASESHSRTADPNHISA